MSELRCHPYDAHNPVGKTDTQRGCVPERTQEGCCGPPPQGGREMLQWRALEIGPRKGGFCASLASKDGLGLGKWGKGRFVKTFLIRRVGIIITRLGG